MQIRNETSVGFTLSLRSCVSEHSTRYEDAYMLTQFTANLLNAQRSRRGNKTRSWSRNSGTPCSTCEIPRSRRMLAVRRESCLIPSTLLLPAFKTDVSVASGSSNSLPHDPVSPHFLYLPAQGNAAETCWTHFSEAAAVHPVHFLNCEKVLHMPTSLGNASLPMKRLFMLTQPTGEPCLRNIFA